MSSGLTAAPVLTEEGVPNVRTMRTVELKSHIERCQRLMRHEALLERLPDRGACVKRRYSMYTEELDRRDKQPRDSINNEERCYYDPLALASLDGVKNNSHNRVRNEEAMIDLDERYFTHLRIIEEKYKDTQVPVEKIVRRMYEGSLSEAQIRRILDDIPPNYFLTHRETCERSKDMARWARKEELQRLQLQSLPRK